MNGVVGKIEEKRDASLSALRGVADEVWKSSGNRPDPPFDTDPEVIRAAIAGERLARAMCRESVLFLTERLNMAADTNKSLRAELEAAHRHIDSLVEKVVDE